MCNEANGRRMAVCGAHCAVRGGGAQRFALSPNDLFLLLEEYW